MSIKNTLNRGKKKTEWYLQLSKERKNGKNLVVYERKTTGIKKQ